jgi:hypothetical protein
MHIVPSAAQHDSAKAWPADGAIQANSCIYWDFHRQTFANTHVIPPQNRGFGADQEQCRIYALFTNDGVFIRR